MELCAVGKRKEEGKVCDCVWVKVEDLIGEKENSKQAKKRAFYFFLFFVFCSWRQLGTKVSSWISPTGWMNQVGTYIFKSPPPPTNPLLPGVRLAI